MLQKDFRDIFLDNILDFLWRQWSAIGVLGEARARELLQLPETSVRYLGFPVHVGTIGDKVYLLSLAENDGESIVITDVALAGQISRIFDKRFSLATGYK